MLLAETLVLVLGLLSGLVAELALLLGMLLVLPGILLMALLPEMLLSGLVLGDLAVLGALAVELMQPPFAASLAPRGLFFPRLFSAAFPRLLLFVEVFLLRRFVKLAVATLPALVIDEHSPPCLAAR